MALAGPSPEVMTLFLIWYLTAAFPGASARVKRILVCPHGLCEPALAASSFTLARHTLFLAQTMRADSGNDMKPLRFDFFLPDPAQTEQFDEVLGWF